MIEVCYLHSERNCDLCEPDEEHCPYCGCCHCPGCDHDHDCYAREPRCECLGDENPSNR